MATVERDVEAATPMYAPQVSPKIEELLEERPTIATATQGASIPQLVIASMPRMLIQMAWTAQFLAIGPVFTTRFATKLISVINPITTLLLSPVVGVISDRCTHQWGRRRPFLVFATLTSAVVLFLSCFTADIGEAFDGDSWRGTGVSFFAVIFYLANTLALVAMETPMMLLVADLAGERQITGAALGQGWSILGSIFVVTYFQVIPESSRGAFVAVCILLMLLIAGIVYYNVQESPREPEEARSGVLTTVSSSLGSLPTMLIVYGIISVLIGYGVSNYSSNRLNFFDTRVVSDSDDYYSYYYSSDSSLGEYKYFMIEQVFAYIFTWLLPLLTNKIGANHALTISLGPQALLIIMAFVQSKTLVGIMDFLVTVFRGTLYVLIVPAVVHVYGPKNIGACVGALTAISSLGSLLSIIIGDSINETDLMYQLPVLLAGIMAAMCIVISAFMLQLKLKSL